MAILIRDLLDNRAAALARQFHDDRVPPLVLAKNLHHITALHSHGGGTVTELGGHEGRALVWTKPGVHGASVWIKASDRDYRAIFKDFIDATYADVNWEGFADFDVDHLYNKSNAQDADWLRVEGIAGGINRSHGASFERRNTNSTIEIANRATTEQSLMTFMMLLKLAGLKPPRTMDDTQRLGPTQALLQANGWPKAEVDSAMEGLLAKSRWRK